MSETTGACTTKCWGAAGLIGLFVAILTLALTGRGLLAAIVLGLLTFALLGLLFNWLFCAEAPKPGETRVSAADTTASTGAGASSGVASAGMATAAGAATAAAASSASADTSAKAGAGDGASGADNADANAASADSAQTTSDSATEETSGNASGDAETAAAGESVEDVEGSDAKTGGDTGGDTEGEADASTDGDAEASTGSDTAGSVSDDDAGSASAAAANVTVNSNAGSATLVASTPLAGQEELASRKGSWTYQGAATASKATSGDPAPTGADQDNIDRDGDGKIEGKDEGTKPKMMDGPREGGADNLKEVKGIGPKLEKLCNSLGIYHFDQIAAWTSDELAWIDSNLAGFKGRATRDDWVGQAKILAAGGETEFSQRVDSGKVY